MLLLHLRDAAKAAALATITGRFHEARHSGLHLFTRSTWLRREKRRLPSFRTSWIARDQLSPGAIFQSKRRKRAAKVLPAS
jgi:hypothetical protein